MASREMATLLPTEMLERIFWLLSLGDLAVVVLVCRRWRQVGEAPRLWSGIRPTVTSANMKLLGSRRLQTVKKAKIVGITDTSSAEELLKRLLEHKSLKSLEIVMKSSNVLSHYVTPMKLSTLLFSRVINKMEDLRIAINSCTQFNEILISISYSKLRRLGISFHDQLCCFPPQHPGLLAKAVRQLEELDLSGVYFDNLQAKEIFTAIGGGSDSELTFEYQETEDRGYIKVLTMQATNPSNKLRRLALGLSDDNLRCSLDTLNTLDPGLLARSVAKLEEVSLTRVCLNKLRYEEILLAVGRPESMLKKLTFGCKNLLTVDSLMLAQSLNKMEEAKLLLLNNEQLHAILSQTLEKTNLKSITIGCVHCLNENFVDESDNHIFSLVAHETGCKVMVEKWLHL